MDLNRCILVAWQVFDMVSGWQSRMWQCAVWWMGTSISEEPTASKMSGQSRLLDLDLRNMAGSSRAFVAVALWEEGRVKHCNWGLVITGTRPKILISISGLDRIRCTAWAKSVDSTHLPNIWHVSIRKLYTNSCKPGLNWNLLYVKQTHELTHWILFDFLYSVYIG
jgi:hypothetical protein